MTSNATSVDSVEAKDGDIVITTPFATISDIHINKKTVKKNEKLKYEFTVSFVDTFDYDSEEFAEGPFKERPTYYVIVYWQSPNKQKIKRTYKWSAEKESLIIKDKISVEKGMQAGQWYVSKIYIENGIGEDGGDSLTIYNGTEAEQAEKGQFSTYYTDMSALSFNVTDVKKKADNKAPTIDKKSLKVSKTKVSADKYTTFTVKVKDTSSIEFVECAWMIKSKGWEESREYKMKYNKKKKCYQCKFKLKKNDVKAELYCITTRDIYGNESVYTLNDTQLKKKYGKAYSKVTVYCK